MSEKRRMNRTAAYPGFESFKGKVNRRTGGTEEKAPEVSRDKRGDCRGYSKKSKR